MSRPTKRDTLLFVSTWSTMGGAQMSLATLLDALSGEAPIALAAPNSGPFMDRARRRASFDRHIVLPAPSRSQVRYRLGVTVALARALVGMRRRLLAVHANGDAEMKLLLPLVPMLALLRVPIVVWYHSKDLSPTTRRLGPIWRLLGTRVRWAAVSDVARQELGRAGIATDRVAIVPNPIDARDVVPEAPRRRHPGDPFVIGYLGCEYAVKGFLLLPGVARALAGSDARLLCVIKGWPEDQLDPTEREALAELRSIDSVEFAARDFDVRNLYARFDCLLVPSLAESFCRIAVEAMLVGIPVVASDLPALREVTHQGAAALLFPVGDGKAAADAIRQLSHDEQLRTRLVGAGHSAAQSCTPRAIAEQLLRLYGLETSSGRN